MRACVVVVVVAVAVVVSKKVERKRDARHAGLTLSDVCIIKLARKTRNEKKKKK